MNPMNMNGSNESQNIISGPTEYNWKLLATAIIMRAIRDYELAIKKNDFNGKNGIKALQTFFASEWCDALVSLSTDINCEYKKGEFLTVINKLIDKKSHKK